MNTIPDSWPFPPEPITGPTYDDLAAIAGTRLAGSAARHVVNIRACNALAREIDAATAELKAFNDGFTAPY